MKNFGAKLLISSFLAVNALPASAVLYKFTFPTTKYTDVETPDVPGTLNGFIIIDSNLAAQDSRFLNGNSNVGFAIPNWITEASLTFTSDGSADAVNVSSETRTLTSVAPILDVRWEPNSGSFDFSADFVGQMSQFSLSNNGSFVLGTGKVQVFNFQDSTEPVGQFQSGEFRLNTPIVPVAVPGPLPLLGLAPLAYYFKKLKKKSNKP